MPDGGGKVIVLDGDPGRVMFQNGDLNGWGGVGTHALQVVLVVGPEAWVEVVERAQLWGGLWSRL